MDEREIIRRLADLKASPSPQADSRILAAAEGAMACPFGRRRRLNLARAIGALAAAAVLVAILGLIGYRWVVRSPSACPKAALVANEVRGSAPSPDGRSDPLARELALAAQRFSNKDVSGLLALLDTGLAHTRIAAAGYLAELIASQALPSLQRLASSWTGDPNSNPFSQAAARISRAAPGPDGRPARRPEGQATTPAARDGRMLKIRVVDALTGQGLAGAKLSGTLSEEGWVWDRWVCDANGCCDIVVSRETSAVVQTSRLPGYVARKTKFPELTEQVLAQTYIFRLDHGVRIGGAVQDPNGSPIGDATVYAYLEAGIDSVPRSSVCLEFRQQTDSAGRWLCDTVPADLLSLAADHPLGLDVGHPWYFKKHAEVNDPSTLNAMLSLAHLTLLDKGGVMRGRIVNEQGEPVVNARVGSCTTDANGVFVVRDLDPKSDSVRLSVSAEGYPFLSRQIDYQPGMGDIEILLYRPGTVDVNNLPRDGGWFAWGRVVDDVDNPVIGAEVTAKEGSRCFTTTTTDFAGRYILGPLPAPIAIMNIQVSARHSTYRTRIVDRPVPGPLDFAPDKGIRVSGKVTDRQTGRPLDQFRIVDSIVDEDGKIRPLLPASEGKAGRYECTLGRPGVSGYVIAIEADGYLPTATRIIGSDEQNPVIDLALTRGTGPSGVVLDANGVAAADAWVYGIPEKRYAWWWRTQPPPYDQPLMSPAYPWVRTRSDGSFSMEPTYQLRWLVAVAAQGICSVTVSEPGEVRRMVLLPWAKVRAVVRSTEGVPAQYQTVEMVSVPQTEAEAGYQWVLFGLKTDERGAFQVDWLPPGKFTLLGKTYEAKPGQVLNLEVTLEP